MKRAVLGLLWCCLAAVVACRAGTDQGAIKANFDSYWEAIAQGDFKAAAVLVHPDDLALLRAEVLPVLLDGAKLDNQRARALVDAFFGSVPADQRSKLSGPELYALCANFVNAYSRQTLEAMEKAERTIVEVKLDNSSKASVRYALKVSDKSVELTDRMGKLNGRWYVNMREPPTQMADMFRQAFAQALVQQ